jgi:hypothetical protein
MNFATFLNCKHAFREALSIAEGTPIHIHNKDPAALMKAAGTWIQRC